ALVQLARVVIVRLAVERLEQIFADDERARLTRHLQVVPAAVSCRRADVQRDALAADLVRDPKARMVQPELLALRLLQLAERAPRVDPLERAEQAVDRVLIRARGVRLLDAPSAARKWIGVVDRYAREHGGHAAALHLEPLDLAAYEAVEHAALAT